jgi:hypothetical protein
MWARERHLSGQRLVEQAAERIDVGPGVHRLGLDLLGRGVVERADPHAGGGDAALRAHVLADPEVGEVGMRCAVSVLDEHVARLDVAVK